MDLHRFSLTKEPWFSFFFANPPPKSLMERKPKKVMIKPRQPKVASFEKQSWWLRSWFFDYYRPVDRRNFHEY
jgi:hypothetical protein